MTTERCLECELSAAASEGDLAALRALIREGADPGSEADCNTALFDAIAEGRADLVATLLDAGADPQRRHSVTGQTPWMAALGGEHHEVVLELRERGVDSASVSLASLVAGSDRPELVGLATLGGIDLNTADPATGRTALHVAATYGYLGTVRCLVEAGADVSVRDAWGNTPATLATRNHHEHVAGLLAGMGVEQE